MRDLAMRDFICQSYCEYAYWNERDEGRLIYWMHCALHRAREVYGIGVRPETERHKEEVATWHA